ncbi:hypothetical protein I3217_00455 [Formosa sp. S-31]
MALVVVFSTLSFSVDMHYCGDSLVDLAINKEAKTCGMDMQESTTPQMSKMAKGCCSDTKIQVDGQDELKLNTLDQLSFDQFTFVATYFYVYINLFEGLEEHIVPFKAYSPPLLVTDISVINATFLI